MAIAPAHVLEKHSAKGAHAAGGKFLRVFLYESLQTCKGTLNLLVGDLVHISTPAARHGRQQ
eukprot:230692-Pleurochrysis_carterae.AAC.3